MKLAEAFSVAVEEVNAVNPALRLEAVKRYLTIDDSIVLQDLCELAKYLGLLLKYALYYHSVSL